VILFSYVTVTGTQSRAEQSHQQT